MLARIELNLVYTALTRLAISSGFVYSTVLHTDGSHCFPVALRIIASPFAARELPRVIDTANWPDCRIRLLSQLAVYGSLKHTTTAI